MGCGRCIAICPKNAVQINWDETTTNLNRKIAEYTKAVVDGRPCFHISLVIDVSPNCDCHAENDMPIVPNVGMFASFDPVALDMACVDAVNAQTPLRGSAADGGESHVHAHPPRHGLAQLSGARREDRHRRQRLRAHQDLMHWRTKEKSSEPFHGPEDFSYSSWGFTS